MKHIETDRPGMQSSAEQVSDVVTPEEGLRLISAFRRIEGAREREEALRLLETLASEAKRS